MSSHQYQLLLDTIVRHDIRASLRPGYNRYAIFRHVKRLEEIREDTNNARPLRKAIIMGFCGHLQSQLLHAVGEPPAAFDEKFGLLIYEPATMVEA